MRVVKYWNGKLNSKSIKFNPNFSFELDPEFRSYEKMEPGSKYGVIKIGDFYEHFYMSPSLWPIKEYVCQWNLAFERLNKGEKETHFIVNIQSYTPMIVVWTAHKVENKLYIQNSLILKDLYLEKIGNKLLTPENSFDFIRPRETISDDKTPISEWNVKIIKTSN